MWIIQGWLCAWCRVLGACSGPCACLRARISSRIACLGAAGRTQQGYACSFRYHVHVGALCAVSVRRRAHRERSSFFVANGSKWWQVVANGGKWWHTVMGFGACRQGCRDELHLIGSSLGPIIEHSWGHLGGHFGTTLGGGPSSRGYSHRRRKHKQANINMYMQS